MAGITDERHLVEAGLALCAALRTLTPGCGETADLLTDAEDHLNAVRTPNKPKAEKPAEAKKGEAK